MIDALIMGLAHGVPYLAEADVRPRETVCERVALFNCWRHATPTHHTYLLDEHGTHLHSHWH
jgi:hypothetical protein